MYSIIIQLFHPEHNLLPTYFNITHRRLLKLLNTYFFSTSTQNCPNPVHVSQIDILLFRMLHNVWACGKPSFVKHSHFRKFMNKNEKKNTFTFTS